MKRLLTFILLLLCARAKASSADYYIDFVSGADSNNGLSTGAAWKHHPDMQGWTGSYSQADGDQFYFKGGSTWPNACFPFVVSRGGSSVGSFDFYGTNASWGTGRAIFDMGGAPTPTVSFYQNQVMPLNADTWPSNILIRGIQFTGYYWSAASPGQSYIGAGNSTNIQTVDCLFTNWSHGSAVSGTADSFNPIYGSTSLLNPGCFASNCIVDGRPNGTDSACAFYCIPTVVGCTVANMRCALLPNGSPSVCYSNIIGPLNASFNGSHGAGWEPQGQLGDQYCYDNIIHDSPEVSVMIGGNGASGNAYIYNNIIYNSGVGVLLKWQSGGANQAFVWGNTIDISSAPDYAMLSESGTWSAISAQNNLIIGITSVSVTASYLTNDHNIYLTSGAASADGYTPANLYRPVGAFLPTVATGVNLSTTFAALGLAYADFGGVPRTNDIGAWQYQGDSASPSPFQGVTIRSRAGAPVTIRSRSGAPVTVTGR